MGEMIFQYVLIVILILGLGYLIYLIKDRGTELFEDYFGLTYAILNTLQSDESTKENIKAILRVVSQIVSYVEIEFLNMDNLDKEEIALKICREAIQHYGFESPIDDNSIRYLIRISSAMSPAKEVVKQGKVIGNDSKEMIEKVIKKINNV